MAENPTSETEGMSTTITHPEPWLCVVKAEVAREVFDKEYAQRLKKAVRGHQKPGFRKGRPPGRWWRRRWATCCAPRPSRRSSPGRGCRRS